MTKSGQKVIQNRYLTKVRFGNRTLMNFRDYVSVCNVKTILYCNLEYIIQVAFLQEITHRDNTIMIFGVENDKFSSQNDHKMRSIIIKNRSRNR